MRIAIQITDTDKQIEYQSDFGAIFRVLFNIKDESDESSEGD